MVVKKGAFESPQGGPAAASSPASPPAVPAAAPARNLQFGGYIFTRFLQMVTFTK